MSLQAIIVDDERLARRELAAMLGDLGSVSVLGEADSLNGALALIEEKKPDVVFLDIQLSGETGFDLLEMVDCDFAVVFVTAFDSFAIRAFEVNALDYLLKPVNPDRLAEAVERVVESADTEPSISERALTIEDSVLLESGQRSFFARVTDISHIVSAGDYTELFLTDGRKFLSDRPLREWEDRLPGSRFVRIHRGSIVNLESVGTIENHFNRTMVVHLRGTGAELAVSRRYAARLKERFG